MVDEVELLSQKAAPLSLWFAQRRRPTGPSMLRR